MIRGMVARLAARLEQNPSDKEGWARLAHAYDVLGEKDKAEAARARAEAASAATPASPPNDAGQLDAFTGHRVTKAMTGALYPASARPASERLNRNVPSRKPSISAQCHSRRI